MELRICHLYPDVLNLYGDVGNLIAIEKRLQWRGIDCGITPVKMGEKADFSEFDLVFIGSGREEEQKTLAADLLENKAEALRTAAEKGTAILAIGGGMELLGRYIELSDGGRIEGAAVLDMHTVGGKSRHTGNYMFTTPYGEIVAFENHSGSTYLSEALDPLGTVEVGYGNNGEGREGVRYKNVFGSYGHGSLLPKNPTLCDAVLKAALSLRHGEVELTPLDDAAEQTAHDHMVDRLKK